MSNFRSALWAETLKLRKSKVPYFLALGFVFFPLVDGLFMFILKNPEAAKSLGLITTKAQLLTGTADWPSFFTFLSQATAVGAMVLFSIFTIWSFGREFSDHTVKELLALPTPRWSIVSAKFLIMALWSLAITASIFGIGLLVGTFVKIPGWNIGLLWPSFLHVFGTAALTIPLMSFSAFIASIGRGYLLPFGWTIFVLFLANLSGILGWGDWFPWAIPGLFGTAASIYGNLPLHSFLVLIVTSLFGFAVTYYWWQNADQTK